MSIKSKYKSNYKNRKNIKVGFLIVSAVLFLGLVASLVVLLTLIKDRDRSQEKDASNQITVYTAREDIKTGQAITVGMMEEIQIEPMMQEEFYLSMEDCGEIAIIDIPKGMLILDNMCKIPEIENGQREVECEIISLSNNLSENDYVDVRIMLPNGEDYIVLAKKSVHEVKIDVEKNGNSCYLWMSEDEILYYSAAIVDAYLYSGASLYTTKYIDPTIQEASVVTYVPSMNTLTMIKENPNMIMIATTYLQDNRKRLENRLTEYLNKDVKEVLWKEEIEPLSPQKETNQQTKEQQVEEKDQVEEREKVEAAMEQVRDEEGLSVFVEDEEEEVKE